MSVSATLPPFFFNDLNRYYWTTDARAVTLAARISARFGGSGPLSYTSCRVQVRKRINSTLSDASLLLVHFSYIKIV